MSPAPDWLCQSGAAFTPSPDRPPAFILRHISDKAEVHPEACIGAHVIIADGAKIGARTVLHGNNYVDEDCEIGEDCAIFHNVTLYPRTKMGNRVRVHAGTIIGSDGSATCRKAAVT